MKPQMPDRLADDDRTLSTDVITDLILLAEARVDIRCEAFDHYNEQLHKEAGRLVYRSQTSATRKDYYVNKGGRLQVSALWDGEEYFARAE